MTDYTPSPYQLEGAKHLASQRAAYLGDDPGLGKTAQALLALKRAEATSARIVSPAIAVSNWYREAEIWNPEIIPGLEVVSWGMPSRGQGASVQPDRTVDALIIDEAHRLKSIDSTRTLEVIREYVPRAGATWLMSGTPAPAHPGDLYVPLRTFRPDVYSGSYEDFVDRYVEVTPAYMFGGRKRNRVIGPKNTVELDLMLHGSGFFKRRTRKEVLPELPDMRVDAYPLPLNPPPEVASEFYSMGAPEHATDDELFDWMDDLPDADRTRARRILGLAKVSPAAEYIAQEAERYGKVIAFAYHREVLLALHSYRQGLQSVLVTGATKPRDRDQHMLAFQYNPEVRVFYGQIDACSEAITLTASSRVILVEAAWNPTTNMQAICRAWRRGQKNFVRATFLSFARGPDAAIARVNARKTAALDPLGLI